MPLPSFSFPANPAAFMDAYNQGFQATQDAQDRALARQLYGMRLSQLADEQAQRQRVRSILQNIEGDLPGLTPSTVPVSTPGLPAVPADPALGGGPDSAFPAMPAVPSRASVVSAVTTPQMAEAMGGWGNYATVAATPEGQALMKGVGAITPEQFKRRQDIAQARLDYQQAQDEADRLTAAGDAPGALLAHQRSLRAWMGVIDDPAQLMSQARQLDEYYTRLQKDPQERKATEQNMPAWQASYAKLRANPDDPLAQADFLRFAASPSKTLQEMTLTMFPQMAKESAAAARANQTARAFSALNDTYRQLANSAHAAGKPVDSDAIWAAAIQQNPDAAQVTRQAYFAGQRLPDGWVEGLFPGMPKGTPKNDIEMAYRQARDEGLAQGTPGFDRRVATIIEEHARNKRMTPEQQAAQAALNQARAGHLRILTQASTETKRGGLTPQTRNALTKSLKVLQDLATGTDMTPEMKVRLERDFDQTERLLHGDTGTHANHPPAQQSVENAAAELKRLMTSGMTKPEAVSEMQQAGWDIK